MLLMYSAMSLTMAVVWAGLPARMTRARSATIVNMHCNAINPCVAACTVAADRQCFVHGSKPDRLGSLHVLPGTATPALASDMAGVTLARSACCT